MTQTDETSVPGRFVDAGGVVEVSMPCRECSYDLRGLSRDGKCPECGSPVSMSLGGWLLRFAPVTWLERLTIGAALIAVGTSLMLLSPLIGIGLQVFGDGVAGIALVGVAGLGLLADLLGSMLFSAAPPLVRPAHAFYLVGRSSLHKGVQIFAVLLGIVMVSALFPQHLAGLTVVAVVGCLIMSVHWHLSLLGYVREIMLRIPADRLAGWMTVAQSSLGLAIVLFFPGVCAGLASTEAIAGCFLLPIPVLLAPYPVVMVLAWLKLREQVRIARELARSV